MSSVSTAVDNPANPKPVWSEARKRATKVCMALEVPTEVVPRPSVSRFAIR